MCKWPSCGSLMEYHSVLIIHLTSFNHEQIGSYNIISRRKGGGGEGGDRGGEDGGRGGGDGGRRRKKSSRRRKE